MSNQYPTIGVATELRLGEGPASSEGVAFDIEYGAKEFSLALSNKEMDMLLQSGISQMLGNSALGGFQYTIELPFPDLPLFVGVRKFEVTPRQPRPTKVFPYPDLRHDASMETSIVTMSHAYEQRGIMLANRNGEDGSWEFKRYDRQPPLRDAEEVFY